MKIYLRTALLTFVLLPFAALAVDWGVLTPAPLPVPNAAGPVHHSKTFIAKAPIQNGVAQIKLPLDTPENSLMVIFGEQKLTARVKQSGALLQKRQYRQQMLTKMGVPAVGTRLNVSKLSAGEQILRIETAKREGVLHYAVAQPDSPLALQVQVHPLAAQSGEMVTVTADLSSAAIASARVNANVRGMGPIALSDNGQGADLRANDDIFTGQFRAPTTPGLKNLRLRVDATGQLAGSTAFKRTAGAGIMVSASSAALGAIQTAPDQLGIDLTGEPGRYRVEVIYGANGQTLAWANDTVTINANAAATAYLRAGDKKNRPIRHIKRSAPERFPGQPVAQHITLPRPDIAAAADQAVVRLLNLDTLALEAETLVELTPLTDVVPRFQKPAPGLPDSKAEAARRFGQRAVSR
ncbi:MAG TPA: hypothetical protein VFP95_01885 [Gammaproteobacteria bacterium]|nr:hypothetical protein [Gammaproteobacteria bacterium]